MSGRIVFFDLESGGLDPEKHAIIQFAAIAVSDDLLEEHETLELKMLFPQSSATAEALEVNSYDPEVWAREGIPPREAEPRISSFLRRHATVQKVSAKGKAYSIARLAGHNAAAFDVPFLRAWYRRRDKFSPFSWHALDTLSLAIWTLRHRDVRSFKLADLCKFYGIELAEAHDALADVRATLELARALDLELQRGGERPAWDEPDPDDPVTLPSETPPLDDGAGFRGDAGE